MPITAEQLASNYLSSELESPLLPEEYLFEDIRHIIEEKGVFHCFVDTANRDLILVYGKVSTFDARSGMKTARAARFRFGMNVTERAERTILFREEHNAHDGSVMYRLIARNAISSLLDVFYKTPNRSNAMGRFKAAHDHVSQCLKAKQVRQPYGAPATGQAFISAHFS